MRDCQCERHAAIVVFTGDCFAPVSRCSETKSSTCAGHAWQPVILDKAVGRDPESHSPPLDSGFRRNDGQGCAPCFCLHTERPALGRLAMTRLLTLMPMPPMREGTYGPTTSSFSPALVRRRAKPGLGQSPDEDLCAQLLCQPSHAPTKTRTVGILAAISPE
jgi:hypothetical protein